MSDLVFIAFDTEEKAEEVRKKVLEMQKEYLIEVEDAVIATRDANGKINLHQMTNTTAQGALGGALLGHADRLDLPHAGGRRGAWRGRRRARRRADRLSASATTRCAPTRRRNSRRARPVSSCSSRR